MNLRDTTKRQKSKFKCCDEDTNINPIKKAKRKQEMKPSKNNMNITTSTRNSKDVKKVLTKKTSSSPNRIRNDRTALNNNNKGQLSKTEADAQSSTSGAEGNEKRILRSTVRKENEMKSNSPQKKELRIADASDRKSCKKRTLIPKKISGSKTSKMNSVKEHVAVMDLTCTNTKETSCDKIEQKSKGSSKKSSASFQKYGMLIPSYEDILKEREECDKYHALICSLEKLISPTEDIKLDISDDDPSEECKDCKHMTTDAIVSAFERNLDYLNKIRDGTIYRKRHELFKKTITNNGLIYNTSMILFKDEHKDMLIKKLCKQYGDDDLSSSDYYFKVLLPELCLKIFMDEYSMTHEEAVRYLNYE